MYKDRAGYSVSIVRQLKTVLNVFFRYVVENKLVLQQEGASDSRLCIRGDSGRAKKQHHKKLLKNAGLPDIRWHDLRSTYCTLLLKSDFNPKAVSKLMGHAKELITVDVYGDNQNIIPEEIPELLSYMEDVMPKKNDTPNQQDKILDADIAMEEYLPMRRKEVPSQGNKFSEQMF